MAFIGFYFCFTNSLDWSGYDEKFKGKPPSIGLKTDFLQRVRYALYRSQTTGSGLFMRFLKNFFFRFIHKLTIN